MLISLLLINFFPFVVFRFGISGKYGVDTRLPKTFWRAGGSVRGWGSCGVSFSIFSPSTHYARVNRCCFVDGNMAGTGIMWTRFNC